ncbi:hypothetical protein [Paenibacillus castaneae]|nr:hypothetical protein [Paenibacillus castaneae]
MNNGIEIPAEVHWTMYPAARKIGIIQSFIEALQPAGFLSVINVL